jgi:anti-repressor protein
MNDLSIFNYGQNEVRTVLIDGEPWFVARDVCEVLGISNVSDTLSKVLDDDEKGIATVYTLGGVQQVSIISEAGLYSLTLKSRKPEAKLFKRWITHEVLPTIRKTGGVYMSLRKAEELLSNPDLIIGYAQQVKELRAQAAQQQQRIDADRPKVLFSDALTCSPSTILVRELAKLLHQNGVDMGEKRLFEWLRENGYLIKRGYRDYNQPTQRAMEMGLIEVQTRNVSDASGKVIVTKTPRITGAGQVYFINKFLTEEAEACG